MLTFRPAQDHLLFQISQHSTILLAVMWTTTACIDSSGRLRSFVVRSFSYTSLIDDAYAGLRQMIHCAKTFFFFLVETRNLVWHHAMCAPRFLSSTIINHIKADASLHNLASSTSSLSSNHCNKFHTLQWFMIWFLSHVKRNTCTHWHIFWKQAKPQKAFARFNYSLRRTK